MAVLHTRIQLGEAQAAISSILDQTLPNA